MPECRRPRRLAPVVALLVTVVLTWSACPPAVAVDLPDPLYHDTNLDGIDGDIAAAVFVHPAGSDTSGDGSPSGPFRSINHSITRAVEQGKTQVLVAGGTYPELVRVVDGVHLFGGYDGPPYWGRSAESESTITYGGFPLMPHVFALEAVGITSPTIVEGFTITCGEGLNGRSSYGVRAFESPGLTLRHNIITAGDGGEGDEGFAGAAGTDGEGGQTGGIVACVSLNGGAGGAGGAGCSPGGEGGRGGAKGPYAGGDGEGSPGSGGEGGLIAEPGGAGADGWDGPFAGETGSLGLGGRVVNGYWTPDTGGKGGTGSDGAGGGGGGGGGGYGCLSGLCGGNTPGNGGGGGGAGGCGGGGGTGGTGGAASIAVLATASEGLVISDCVLRAGNGGPGGAGGNGGPGGAGGRGGLGGVSPLCLHAGWGGNGGDGGDGAPGGRGGAGAGGPSWAVLSPDGGLTLVDNTCSNGLSGGGPGRPGAAGSVRLAGQTLPMSDVVRLSHNRVAPGAQVKVTMNLFTSTPDAVMVNGVPMQKTAPQEWRGVLTAPDEPGTYHVAASYGDGDYVYGGSFEVQNVFGVRGSQAELVMQEALGRHLFRVWGQVSSRGGNTLELTDGSGAVVRVTADAALLTGITPGTFVIATGELDSRMQPAALQAHSVEKVEPEAVP